MTSRRHREEALGQAVDWFVRLRSPAASIEDRNAHAEWLAADPEHARAYGRIERQWRELDGLEQLARARLADIERRARRRRTLNRRIRGLAAAAVVLLVLGGMVWQAYRDGGGARFETVKAEQRRIFLNDGSLVYLNTDSVIDAILADGVREVLLGRGEALFEVAPDPHRPFVVRAASSSLVAVGTRFSAHLDRTDLVVTVVEGRVAVVPEMTRLEDVAEVGMPEAVPGVVPVTDAGGTILTADQQARLGTDGRLKAVSSVNAENETAWRTGRVIFDNTPLREVVRELSRYSNVEMRVAPDVADHPVTGVIDLRSAGGNLAELLAGVVPVRAVCESATMTVLHNLP